MDTNMGMYIDIYYRVIISHFSKAVATQFFMSSLGVEVRTTLLDIPPPLNNGVFALRKFKKNEIVVVYARPGDGSIQLDKDKYERRRKKNQVYGVDVQRNTVVDAAKSSHLGKYVNMLKHRNNVRLVTNWWGPGQRQITFKANRTIQIGEEIYSSYGPRYRGMDAKPRPRPPMRRGPKPRRTDVIDLTNSQIPIAEKELADDPPSSEPDQEASDGTSSDGSEGQSTFYEDLRRRNADQQQQFVDEHDWRGTRHFSVTDKDFSTNVTWTFMKGKYRPCITMTNSSGIWNVRSNNFNVNVQEAAEFGKGLFYTGSRVVPPGQLLFSETGIADAAEGVRLPAALIATKTSLKYDPDNFHGVHTYCMFHGVSVVNWNKASDMAHENWFTVGNRRVLFKTSSRINHSCDPNMVRRHRTIRGTPVVEYISTKEIKPQDQLFIQYSVEAGHEDDDFFECACDRTREQRNETSRDNALRWQEHGDEEVLPRRNPRKRSRSPPPQRRRRRSHSSEHSEDEQSSATTPPPRIPGKPLADVRNLSRPGRAYGPTPFTAMSTRDNLDPPEVDEGPDPQIYLSDEQMYVIQWEAQYRRRMGLRVGNWDAAVARIRNMSRTAQLRKYRDILRRVKLTLAETIIYMRTNYNIVRQVPGNVLSGKPEWDDSLTEKFVQLDDDGRETLLTELRGIMENINANCRQNTRREVPTAAEPVEVDGDPVPPSDSSLTSDSSDSQDSDSSNEASGSDHPSDFSDSEGDEAPGGPPHRLPRNHRHYVPQNVNRGILINMIRRYARVADRTGLIQEIQRQWPNMTREAKARAYKGATRHKRAYMRKRRRLAHRARHRRQRPPQPGPRLPKSWTNAIREWRRRTGVAENSPWCTPMKGSPEYLIVRAIYDRM
jgi:hypothetical protein